MLKEVIDLPSKRHDGFYAALTKSGDYPASFTLWDVIALFVTLALLAILQFAFSEKYAAVVSPVSSSSSREIWPVSSYKR